ncbi:MAG: right-handed parallel beta-helix repeat-containing protein [Methanophagales archaeon]|nr:right-handed parallel beta-helix repeat-containing protein [Methanophagales archaeon]
MGMSAGNWVKSGINGSAKECKVSSLKKSFVTAILVVSVLAMFTAVAGATTHYVNPGDSIQSAVNAANPGDIIIVRDGTYTENVDVNKRLTVRSENGSALTTVRAASTDEHVFHVTADYVNITGFTVENATKLYKAGINLDSNVDHCNVSDNKASGNYFGIYLYQSSHNTLSNNTANLNTYYGITIRLSSNYNTLTNNTAN